MVILESTKKTTKKRRRDADSKKTLQKLMEEQGQRSCEGVGSMHENGCQRQRSLLFSTKKKKKTFPPERHLPSRLLVVHDATSLHSKAEKKKKEGEVVVDYAREVDTDESTRRIPVRNDEKRSPDFDIHLKDLLHHNFQRGAEYSYCSFRFSRT